MEQHNSMDDDNYDAKDDGLKSYLLAIETKRLRGDKHWPKPLTKEDRMDISDKIKLANKVGLSLIYTENELARELESYDRAELADDRDFIKYLADTTIQCSNCGVWGNPSDVKKFDCAHCADEWEEE